MVMMVVVLVVFMVFFVFLILFVLFVLFMFFAVVVRVIVPAGTVIWAFVAVHSAIHVYMRSGAASRNSEQQHSRYKQEVEASFHTFFRYGYTFQTYSLCRMFNFY